MIDGASSKSPWPMAPIHGVETLHLDDVEPMAVDLVIGVVATPCMIMVPMDEEFKVDKPLAHE